MFRTQDEEDHLYDFNTTIDSGYGNSTYGKAPATAFRTPGTAANNKPPITSNIGQANRGASRAGVPASRMGTAGGGGGGDARPMTSVSGAGYQSNKEPKAFDPLNIGRGPAPPLAEKSDNGPEYTAKDMEKKVHRLLEASAQAAVDNDNLRCLEKAKEAGKAERALCKYKETHGLSEQINIDLTYSIFFNLAHAHYLNHMYEEALNTYKVIVKNKQYPQSGRLRINMGNIYYDQKLYQQAIKMYRMALDQIPQTGRELRFRVTRNIGNAFVKLGQYQDAIESYESIMAGSPDVQTGFNLLLCLYARGDVEKVKRHFVKMLSVSLPGMTEHDEEVIKELIAAGSVSAEFDVESGVKFDFLKFELQKRMEHNSAGILTCARLISPLVAEDKEDWLSGYKWVMEQLRPDFEIVSSKLEIDLAMEYMRKKQFEEAIEVLKSFEKKDLSLKAMAATNLSFIYFLEGDIAQAEKHAEVAVKADRYNAKALVNKGNCLYMGGEYMRAKEMYLEAIGVEADCVEAIFNLGMVNIKINANQEANQAFEKLHTILPTAPEALYQLGALYERGGTVSELEQAAKTYELLLHKVPGDPNVCNRLGQVYEKLEDENTACHWMTEAHRHFPVNLNVISWLGVWYVKREMYEQAIEFFSQAAAVQPGEVKWRLMVTSCYRRLGDYFKALELYQQIHEDYPQNIESLQYLEALCKDLGRPHDEYSAKLEKLRRSSQSTSAPAATPAAPAPQSTQQQSGPPSASAGGRSERPARPERNAAEDASRAPPTLAFAAPRAAGQQRNSQPDRGGARPARNVDEEEDEFGDTDVTSLLE